MKFGAREICDVVLKAKVDGQKVGDNVYKKGQPVIYFDSLKTTSMEQATTPVYAQGGKGNTKLVSWEGEKTITFVMEDALLSPISFAILAKANIKTNKDKPIHVQGRFNIDVATVEAEEDNSLTIKDTTLAEQHKDAKSAWASVVLKDDFRKMIEVEITGNVISAKNTKEKFNLADFVQTNTAGKQEWKGEAPALFLDYYAVDNNDGSQIITIEPETFEGNYYLEASTLFRTTDGVDLPAEFIIPNCKPQSAMSIALASTGDPSTFTFTMDTFPDYLAFDPSKKVLAAIQIIDNKTEDIATGIGTGLTQF